MSTAHMKGKTAKSSKNSPAKSNLVSQAKGTAGVKAKPIHKTGSRISKHTP